MGITITVIYQRDSHFKSTRSLREVLVNAGCVVVDKSFDQLSLEEFKDLSFLSSDVLILSCGGRAINQIVGLVDNLFDKERERPVLVANFPGIVCEDQLEAYITRLRCDLVLLNSRKDELIHKKICAAFRRPYNGVLAGALWFENFELSEEEGNNIKATVFFEQDDVPRKYNDRELLAVSIAEVAQRHPDRIFYIKPRGSELKKTSLYSLINATPEIKKRNIALYTGHVKDILNSTDSCLTVSSSAALEALLCNKKVFLVNVGRDKENHLDFYKGSGLILSPEEIHIDNGMEVNKGWAHLNVCDPRGQFKNVVDAIFKASFEEKKEVYWISMGEKMALFRVSLFFPKMLMCSYISLKKKVYMSCKITQGQRDV